MAYTEVPLRNTGDPFYNADEINNWIKNNFAAGIPHNVQAKGDLFPATGSQAGDRLPVGTNGQTLIADSTQTTGMRWDYRAGEKQVTTKGDLVAGSAADSLTRVPAASANNMTLFADSAQSSGMRWGYPPELDVATTANSLISASAASTVVQVSGSTSGNFVVLLADSAQSAGLHFANHPHYNPSAKVLMAATGADALSATSQAGYGEVLIADSTQANGVRWGGVNNAIYAGVPTVDEYATFASGVENEVHHPFSDYLKRVGGSGTDSPVSFVPSVSGYYLIAYSGRAAGLYFSTGNVCRLRIKVNTTYYHVIDSWYAEASNVYCNHPLAAGIIYLNAGDTVKVTLYHNNSTSIDYYGYMFFAARIR